jgi:c-di-GMP-related signal transduction protein
MSAHAKSSPRIATVPNAFVGRQAILDREQQVFGYELLFRSNNQDNFFAATDGDRASCQTMNTALNVMGLQAIIGSNLGFVNITRKLLLRRMYTVLPKEATVIELLENVEPDSDVISACRRLKDDGYLLALDDFVFAPGYEPLLDLADFVKIQFLGVSPEERRTITDRFAKSKINLIAEKVESRDDFEEGLRLGYSYFQGYFFCKPEIMSGREIPSYKQNYIRFLQQINRPKLNFEELESIVKQEVSLSVKLLRYLNSAKVGLRVKIDSIRQAMTMLGEEPLKRWGSLIALTSLGDDKPAELVTICLIRARFCELLAPLAGLAGRELDMFLLGLLSAADALVNSPMSHVLGEMPLAHDVKSALLGGTSIMGSILGLTMACERSNSHVIAMLVQKLNLPADRVSQCYCDAMLWADEVLHL